MNDMILNDALPRTKRIWGSLRTQTKVTTLVSSRTLFCKHFQIDGTVGLSLNTVTVAYMCLSPSCRLYVN